MMLDTIDQLGTEIMDNLAVLVGTCDQYSTLWPNFIKCYEKYFPYNVPTIFAGETITVPKYETHLGGKEAWGKRIKGAVTKIKEDYIFFILEDYYLFFDYGEEQIKQYIKDMDKYDMNRLQISRSDFQSYIKTDSKYLKFHDNSEYSFSMQPSIWKRDWILETCDEEYSPWDFECKTTKKYRGQDIKTYIDPHINFDVYFNAVRCGFHKSPGWEQFREKELLDEF